MNTAIKFCLQNRELNAEPFHYKMSGLDDVYLLNGFKIHNTPYGSGVTVERTDDLHKAIGLYLIKNRKVLGPKDFKFLRKTMKITQDDLAECLGVTSQTVARYEKGQTEIPGPADRLTRFVFALHLIPEKDRTRIIEDILVTMRDLEGVDETGDEPVYFGATPEGEWDKASKIRSRAAELAPM